MAIGTTVHGRAAAEVSVRRIGLRDLSEALRAGWQDFLAAPTQLFFLTVLYPVIGVALWLLTIGGNLWELLWPLVAGFALLGPVAALGVYEISRRRERGEEPSRFAAFAALRSPAIGAIAALGLLLLAIFVAWLLAAQAIYAATMGHLPPPSGVGEFLAQVTGTPEGRRLMLLGNGVGFLFAAAVLCLTVVSFPMLLDRDGGLARAIGTSLRAVAANPVPMAVWGLLVAVLIFAGCAVLFVGLAVVLPVLGHATWHLYRRVVA
jgi:uncharacterized membrane protein